MRLLESCQRCGKTKVGVEFTPFSPRETYVVYKCGHAEFIERESFRDQTISLKDVFGKKMAYDFQVDGLDFVDQSGYDCAITDKMGLGKTIQASLAVKVAYGKLTPTLFVVKSATIWQWIREFKEWTDATPLGIFFIDKAKGFIPQGFKTYVVSMDTFSRMIKVETDSIGRVVDVEIYPQLKELGIKLIVVDEMHSFKNTESKRSVALVNYIKVCEIKHKIFLTGTPIKNRADEYFTMLNLLFPTTFTSLMDFRHQWCEQDEQGKYSRIKSWRMDEFKAVIATKVIRRESGVKLPPFRRTNEVVQIEDEAIKKEYNKVLAELQGTIDGKEQISYFDVQDNLMTLRKLTGLAKVDIAVDYITDFVESTEDEKIAIGVHHHGVRDRIYERLNDRGIKVVKLSGEDSAERKAWIVQQFQKDPHLRVLVISILAGGVGIDGLQKVCNNVLVLERQWNACDEEQFEFRFNRDGQKLPVHCNYMVAHKTVDDYFTALVEKKRAIFGETIESNWTFTQDGNAIRELCQQVCKNKL